MFHYEQGDIFLFIAEFCGVFYYLMAVLHGILGVGFEGVEVRGDEVGGEVDQ
jgi:hypothetical protein